MNDKVQEILNEVGKVIRGKDEAIELVMTAMLAWRLLFPVRWS